MYVEINNWQKKFPSLISTQTFLSQTKQLLKVTITIVHKISSVERVKQISIIGSRWHLAWDIAKLSKCTFLDSKKKERHFTKCNFLLPPLHKNTFRYTCRKISLPSFLAEKGFTTLPARALSDGFHVPHSKSSPTFDSLFINI